jgi:hypothetical protein
MIAAAVWSHLPINQGLGGSTTEDDLYSIAASGMGVACATAYVARFWTPRRKRPEVFNVIALCCSVGLLLAMLGLTSSSARSSNSDA